eukprot:CAMPEP_0202955926 /NCGR_PEP_ID=MMETSP1396-20130829/448_1 /ASSEMBLY_ACC=CAM_ASM_000872 /TAXON_ID= /ORGANISM="Pseudokeronopsis sp., Strain Brazil" /LENGTH=57 /DNA_ID=CAMNT_0049672695 /DNA_START=348 /DNA_END=518 /DNA_ORIENTATION=-
MQYDSTRARDGSSLSQNQLWVELNQFGMQLQENRESEGPNWSHEHYDFYSEDDWQRS